jgi:hypothetical protein
MKKPLHIQIRRLLSGAYGKSVKMCVGWTWQTNCKSSRGGQKVSVDADMSEHPEKKDLFLLFFSLLDWEQILQ